jgi:hypothetical protein
MGVGQFRGQAMASEILQIDAVDEQQVGEFHMVNAAQAIEFEDAGNGVGIFDLGEPGVGEVKLGIAFGVRDFWLRSATSRVVRPRRKRMSLSCWQEGWRWGCARGMGKFTSKDGGRIVNSVSMTVTSGRKFFFWRGAGPPRSFRKCG